MKPPELPSVYEPVHLGEADDVAAEAVSRARNGAPEGTLVWSTQQRSGQGRMGRAWSSPEDGLYVGLILRPEFEWARTGELALLGVVSLGAAVASMVEPMTELRYRWPNDVLVGGTKIGGVWLREDPAAGFVVLVVSCNVGSSPEDIVDGGCLLQEGGNEQITPEVLLEHFARQFLAWINRWDEEGFDPVRRAFASRSDREGTPVALVVSAEERAAGLLDGLDDSGNLRLLEGESEKRRSVLLRRYLELD